jgi:hypothetical protein
VGGAGPADPGSAPTGADGKLIAPVIYPAGGMMTAPMLVAFSWPIVSAPEQTQIRYTTDGSEPSEQSTLYSAPFQVSQTCTVKARAFRTGLAAPSAVAAADFMRKSKTTPPVISAGEPTSLLPAGTRQVKIEVTTSEWAMCRYGLQRGGPFERMTPMVSAGGISHSQTLGDLADGQVKTIYVKARDGSGNVTADDYVITVGVADAAAAEPAVIPLAVKEAKLTAPMAAAEEEEKSFVSSSQANKGEAVFTFTAPVTGQYVVWARIFGPDYHSDSFFVSLDGAGEDAFDAAENAWGQWHWIRVNGRDNREVAKLDPRLFILSKGEHTLTFRGREPGCKLEKIIITNDMKYAPPKE